MSAYSLPYRLQQRFGWRPILDADFTLGIVRDMPISSIPAGGLYDSQDWLHDEVGVLRKRGGYTYQSTALSGTTTGVPMVAAPAFPSGAKVVGLGADGHLYDATGGSVVDAGAFPFVPDDNPELIVDKLIVMPPVAGSLSNIQKITWSGSAIVFTDLGGGPPISSFAAAHLSRLVVGGGAAKNRIYFSPIPDIETTWDLLNAYIDTNHNLTAIKSIQGVLVCFSQNHVERITGNIPPGLNETNDNMQIQSLGQVGCVDARSIATWGSSLVFAAQDGVWMTNGASLQSLTEEPRGFGIKSYWRTLYSTAVANGAVIAGGVLNKDYYHLTICYGTTLVDHLVCYLPRKAWWRNTNLGGLSFATQADGTDELYMGMQSGSDGNRIVKVSSLYNPTSSNQNDGDGTAVTPTFTTRNMGVGVGLAAYGHGHLHYRQVDGGHSPTMKVEVATGLGADSFSTVPESPLPAEPNDGRQRFNVSVDSQGVTVRVTQNNASTLTEIYGVELEQRAYALSAEVP